MAAKYRNWTPDVVRDRIRVGVLTKRLHDHALGKAEMTLSQVTAARFLIERVVPRAEAPKQLDISGRITLENLISSALIESSDSERPSPSSH